MTPQKQTILTDKAKGIHGNCLITAYASYMDVPAEECPQFQLLYDVKYPYEGFWDNVVEEWLKQMGYERTFFESDPYEKKEYQDFYFAIGKSPRGNSHIVIYKEGKIYHDPHPENNGIEPTSFEILEKIKGHWRWDVDKKDA